MSSSARRFLAPLFVASVIAAATTLPISPIASAASARIVVAGTTPLPAASSITSTSITASFDVALALKNPTGLTSYINDLSDSSSPFYRHFLTPGEFAARFGASTSTINTVRNYLTGFGLHVRLLTTGHTILEMSGRTNNIARAFATPVETVRLTGGALRAHFAQSATLPTTIAHDVTSVVGLSSLVSATPRLVPSRATSHTTPHTAAVCPGAQASGTNSPNALGGYSAQQEAQLYGLSAAWATGKTGAGQTIAIYELGQYDATDSANFFSCYGLTPSLSAINVDGGTTGGFSDEATLDVEEAGALAPGAAFEIYQAPNTPTAALDLYARIANDNSASIVTTSWGDCEIDPAGEVASEHVIFEQMAAQGQTIIAAAGDEGSSDCTGVTSNAPAVDDPASQPLVTGVGGLSVTSITPLAQTVWNANGGAGGGGVSQVWSRPSWQTGPGITASTTMRMVPDLSVMADPNTGFMQNYTAKSVATVTNWSAIGGTSIGSPLVGALVAVAAQVCGVARLGFINPTLYSLARASKGFVDVTTGSNNLKGTGVYAAGVGYDMASGLGSPNATLVDDLCPSPASVAKSSLVSLTKKSIIDSPSHLVVALRDASGNAIINSSVTVIAKSAAGRIVLDSNPSSAHGSGHAQEIVTTDTNGNASFTLTSSVPGRIAVSVKLNGVPLYSSTINFHALPLSEQIPLTPRVTHVAAQSHGVVISIAAHRANTPFIVAIQVSVDGDRTWHSFPGSLTRLDLVNLQSGTTYVIRVRTKNANGVSPVTPAIRLTTLH
ncbi:MAG TPA: protease pro-enzyme activation domain-containing protein [Acidimicrobiales bacterium]